MYYVNLHNNYFNILIFKSKKYIYIKYTELLYHMLKIKFLIF